LNNLRRKSRNSLKVNYGPKKTFFELLVAIDPPNFGMESSSFKKQKKSSTFYVIFIEIARQLIIFLLDLKSHSQPAINIAFVL
jgi:hypothetical protein